MNKKGVSKENQMHNCIAIAILIVSVLIMTMVLSGCGVQEDEATGNNSSDMESSIPVDSSSEDNANITISVDAELIVEEYHDDSCESVETVYRMPDKYIGKNEQQFSDAMKIMEKNQSGDFISEDIALTSIETILFSESRVQIRVHCTSDITTEKEFYLTVDKDFIVVYLKDMVTSYITTEIAIDDLDSRLQAEVLDGIWLSNEEELYDFIEQLGR